MFIAFNIHKFLARDFCRGSFASVKKMLNTLEANFIAGMIGMFTVCFLELDK